MNSVHIDCDQNKSKDTLREIRNALADLSILLEDCTFSEEELNELSGLTPAMKTAHANLVSTL